MAQKSAKRRRNPGGLSLTSLGLLAAAGFVASQVLGKKDALAEMWTWGRDERNKRTSALSRDDWGNRWGPRGLQLYDAAKAAGMDPRSNTVEQFRAVFAGFK